MPFGGCGRQLLCCCHELLHRRVWQDGAEVAEGGVVDLCRCLLLTTLLEHVHIRPDEGFELVAKGALALNLVPQIAHFPPQTVLTLGTLF